MRKGTRKHFLLIGMTLTSGCTKAPPPEGALSVPELAKEPTHETELSICGPVRKLGGLRCPCFELTCAGGTILVWHALDEVDTSDRPAGRASAGLEVDWVWRGDCFGAIQEILVEEAARLAEGR